MRMIRYRMMNGFLKQLNRNKALAMPALARRFVMLWGLALLAGCTSNGGVAPIQIPLLGDLSKIVVVETKLGKDSILHETLGKNYPNTFTLDDERVAQQALSNNRDGVGSTWHNAKMGDLTIVPVNLMNGNGYRCRDYTLRYTFIGGVGQYKMKAKGQACLKDHLWLVDSKSVSRP
jgi:hypothetical protein